MLGFLIVGGPVLVVLGWRVATQPGFGWKGPRDLVRWAADTSLGRGMSVAVGIATVAFGVGLFVAGLVMLVSHAV